MAGKYAAKGNGTIIPSAKVRAWLYGVLLAASPIPVAYGLMTGTEVSLWLVLAGALLGVSNAVALANTGTAK